MRFQLIKKAFSLMVIMLTFYTVEARGACDAFIKTANGAFHALYLQNDNTVWVSGDNTYGQLGNGVTGSYSTIRKQVNSLTNVVDIASGASHCLALLNDGTVWSWGYGFYGQLGIGGPTNFSATPVQVLLPNDGRKATAIAAGYYFSLVLLDDGTVWAFGRNDFAQLGDNTNADKLVPTQITNNSFKAKAIAAGQQHSLAIQLSDDVVYAWGDNGNGQIGDGTTTQRKVPTATSGSFKGKAIAGGLRHSLAIRLSDDVVFAWGNGSNGQIGDGTFVQRTAPTQTSGAFTAKAIDAGEFNSLAIRLSDNAVYAWGDNTYGTLGNGTGTISNVPTPTNAVNLTGASSISAFYRTAQAIRNSDSSPWGWGVNSFGALGIGYLSSIETLPIALILGPVVTTVPATTTICSEKTVSITFVSSLPDTTYSWTIKSQDAWVSGATEENDKDYFEQILSVTQNKVGTIVYTVTPEADGCPGPSFTITILINPLPIAQATPSEQTICSGEIANIQLESNIFDTTFSYVAAQNGVHGAHSGSGDLIQQGILVTKNIPGTVVYTITPEASGCSGEPITVVVQVNACPPTPPSHFCGKLKKTNGCSFHVLTWTPSPDSSVTAYYLYANGKLIQTVPANGPYNVTVPYDTKPNKVTYKLAAVNEFGVQSVSSQLLLSNTKKCVDNCASCLHSTKRRQG